VSAPGVTDKEIHVVVISDLTNVLGTHYEDFTNGIQAYFDMVNANGGIYGRKLVISKVRDDKMTNNLQEVKNSLNSDNAFATFNATVLFTGANELAKAKMPTFIWNINPEMADKSNIFANVGAICFGCIGQQLPALVHENGYKTIAILGYGVSAESKECAKGDKDSFTKYNPDVKIAVYDDNIAYAEPNLTPQVTQMKNAGVQFVTTCMDNKETLVLAKEMQKQGLNAVQELPNAYEQDYAAANGQYFEGSYVYPQFVPLEFSPLPPLEQKFVDQMRQSNKHIGELAVIGWIDADEFLTGLKLAGPDFSQQKVIDGLNSQTAYSAGGMIQPINWTKQHADPAKNPDSVDPTACATYVQIKSGKFVPAMTQPGKPWFCVGPATDPILAQPTYKSFVPENG
jgi:ABC-type branched-subunit amino acid transport system substrate-binding protein